MSCEESSLETDDDECRLTTRRLVLRIARTGDAADIARFADDLEIAQMTSRIPHPYRLDDAHAFLARAEDELIVAITARDNDAFLGLCSLAAAGAPETAELGYWIGRPHWGRGFATEAAQAAIDYGFAVLELAAIEVRCRVINNGSRRVIQKCGFGYVGTGLSTSLAAGRVASETYRMDRRTWQSLKSWSTPR
ncbi:GNAT family N-acetyltransferase [Aureimonas phyllosphaerae]|uniref:RimJ/RimL family protein N-acetyltransferase n=1 Tax=Aureimonas phyllosphaerae TaxID=1166078 RepID=A0A7W6BUR1_9HYPH|nr:GNAT family N-acetyltransferase [Aureimonas phyllosphaerae]MBB3934091.1 RimJ/RimL family protein N-acetyltransferase [Aureimonas phyllosphaerae]MBB3958693.1 RimJ/RimL family protein N-acetyltransferase [Aureimonas phyllosphaerae]SFF18045.1 Protein N-acetyltransferase, RimJ/RimL family [Aureimonas phyllosphaerae]